MNKIPHHEVLLQLAWLASAPFTAQVLFWAFIMQDNTRMASYVQDVATLAKPSATVYQLSDYRRAA